jgi:four helix bundle protein
VPEERWKKLEVWKLADDMARHVYMLTRDFPKEELYGLTSQVRRAALSIPTNIVEGYSRRGDKELLYFLNISFASLSEVKYLLYFAKSLQYLTEEDYTEIEAGCDELGKRLWSFYEKVKHST